MLDSYVEIHAAADKEDDSLDSKSEEEDVVPEGESLTKYGDDSFGDIFASSDELAYQGHHTPPDVDIYEDSGLRFSEQLNLQGQIEAIIFASPKPCKASPYTIPKSKTFS